MSTRRTKAFLWWAAALLTVGAVVSVCVGAFLPLKQTELPPPGPAPVSAPGAGGPVANTLALAQYEHAWKLDLNGALYDAPDAAPQQPTPRLPATLNARLVGTVIEPGHSCAMFVTRDGALSLLKTGQTIGGAKLLKIEPAGVVVELNGNETELKLEETGGGR